MSDDQIDNYVPQSSNVLCFELHKNLEYNILSILTLNARRITCNFADLITNLNLVGKRFTFFIITEYWLTDESEFVLAIKRYKLHIIIRLVRTGGGIKIFHLECKTTEVIRQISVVEDWFKVFFEAAILGLGDIYVAVIYRAANTP